MEVCELYKFALLVVWVAVTIALITSQRKRIAPRDKPIHTSGLLVGTSVGFLLAVLILIAKKVIA